MGEASAGGGRAVGVVGAPGLASVLARGVDEDDTPARMQDAGRVRPGPGPGQAGDDPLDPSLYTEAFYSRTEEMAMAAAEVIVPIVVGLVRPRSVVDVGCGTGSWLLAFEKQGVTDSLGLDREEVGRAFRLSGDRFRPADLSRPLNVGREFDLAVSLEVAEHLPESAAESFVGSLTRLSPLVLFSAAIPGQGGKNHVNEQWRDYWVRLFASRGYQALDPIRGRVWDDDRVAAFYAQNLMLFARETLLEARPELAAERVGVLAPGQSAVHPRLFEARRERAARLLAKSAERVAKLEDRRGRYEDLSPASALRLLPGLLWRSIRRRLRGNRPDS